MEFLNGRVKRGAVDERVMRSEGHANHMAEPISSRAREVIVDAVEAQRQRLVVRASPRLAWRLDGFERRESLQRATDAVLDPGNGRSRGEIERLEHERRHATGAAAAVVGRMAEH